MKHKKKSKTRIVVEIVLSTLVALVVLKFMYPEKNIFTVGMSFSLIVIFVFYELTLFYLKKGYHLKKYKSDFLNKISNKYKKNLKN